MKKLVRRLYKALRNRKVPDYSTLDPGKYRVKRFNNQVILLLTIRERDNTLNVAEGRGKNFIEALQTAVELYLGSNDISPFRPRSLRLDLVTKVAGAKKNGSDFDLRNDQVLYKNGIDGLMLGKDRGSVVLPEEIMKYRIIENRQVLMSKLVEVLSRHFVTPSSREFIESIKDSIEFDLHKVNLDTFFIDGRGFRSLFRGHRLFTGVDRETIVESLEFARDYYFANVLDSRGKFIYSYLPWEGKREKRYNILRHAGTVYSMLETYEVVGGEKLLQSAAAAVEYLLGSAVDYTLNGRPVSAVVEKNAVKLGGNALAIIALAKHAEVTGDYRHLPLMQRLAAWMAETQDEQGQFVGHKQLYPTGEIFDFVSHYYPGEAVLALVRLNRIDGDENWLDMAERAAHYLIRVRDKKEHVDTIAHDHWLLYALNELYRERRKDLYLEHSLLIARAILKSQITGDEENPDWNGAYRIPHSRLESTPTAIRSEGLGAAYRLALETGHEKEAALIKDAIHAGIKFQLQAQLRPENVLFYKKKKLCLGAFQRGLGKYDLRIDYTQHNLSSLISYLAILDEQA